VVTAAGTAPMNLNMLKEILVPMMTEEITRPKPKFFLHDEVKAWLKDNLVINVTMTGSMVTDHRLVNMGVYHLPAHYTIYTSAKIAGEDLCGDVRTCHLDLKPYHDALVQIVDKLNHVAITAYNLREENNELKRRLELLENPISV
jgi:hypothetical protein